MADLLRLTVRAQKELVRWHGDLDRRHTCDGAGRRKARQAQGTVLGTSAPPFPYDVYDFTENRKRDGPACSWQGTRDTCTPSAFAGYDGIYIDSDGRIFEVACWRMPSEVLEARRRLPQKLR